jgi:endoglucanase
MPITRRGFLAAGLATPTLAALPTPLPRWRGFNLLDLFQAFSRRPDVVSEDELRWIRDWGFNFIRIPMDYWFWTDADWRASRKLEPEDTMKIRESALAPVDRIVELGPKFGLHVSLNFHRAPGYCINNPEREPFVLWSDSRAEDAFVHHWDVVARRYRAIPDTDLSFNLLNEAPRPREGYMRRQDYVRVMQMAIDKIRQTNPTRTIIVDGLDVGNVVVDELIPAGVGQSVHAYWPGQISHYRASWVDRKSTFPLPSWPVMGEGDTIRMGRAQLEERFAPWGALAQKGILVHCGECGCYNKTPHAVFLAWFEDVLQVLEGHGIGFALWNFRGTFGLLDSGREDVAYEDWHGHKLDRDLLAALQRH